ncbi:MAG: hypothetical protein DMG79_11080 [Acidobacteria bacterium]|nr:MAG: hypothetical protein DMG79_11080 [Acidobacteriota bacterium]
MKDSEAIFAAGASVPVDERSKSTARGEDIRVVRHPRCLLCGRVGKELYGELTDWLFCAPGDWGLRHCEVCGLVWLDPQPAVEEIPKLYSKYYTHGNSASHVSFESLRQDISRCVLAQMGYRIDSSPKWLPRLLARMRPFWRANSLDVMGLSPRAGATLLDVGCGSGTFIGKMRSLGWNVTGVDPDSLAVAYAKRQGFEVFHGTISDIPADAHYDVITLSHVIEHVPDPVQLLRECKSHLRDEDSRVVIATPNIDSLGHRWFKRYWRGLEVPRHLLIFSPAALRKCIVEAGLRVNTMRTETRLARMIYNPSVCARAGESEIGAKSNFAVATKATAYLFQALEDAWSCFRNDVGEEIFCICRVP